MTSAEYSTHSYYLSNTLVNILRGLLSWSWGDVMGLEENVLGMVSLLSAALQADWCWLVGLSMAPMRGVMCWQLTVSLA